MKTMMLGLLAESAIHAGAGRSAGIIDLPIAREAATDYPFIPGSSAKGALRDLARRRGFDDEALHRVFGKQDHAGHVLISDARLLLLPVRCLTGAYRWVTSPLLLERYVRDLQRCRITPVAAAVKLPAGKVLGYGTGPLYLEERELALGGPCPEALIAMVAPLIRHAETRKRLAQQLVIVNDDDLAWFCRYAVPLHARNVLDDKTKQSNNLWYEESLPPDSVLYALASARDAQAEASARDLPLPCYSRQQQAEWRFWHACRRAVKQPK